MTKSTLSNNARTPLPPSHQWKAIKLSPEQLHAFRSAFSRYEQQRGATWSDDEIAAMADDLINAFVIVKQIAEYQARRHDGHESTS